MRGGCLYTIIPSLPDSFTKGGPCRFLSRKSGGSVDSWGSQFFILSSESYRGAQSSLYSSAGVSVDHTLIALLSWVELLMTCSLPLGLISVRWVPEPSLTFALKFLTHCNHLLSECKQANLWNGYTFVEFPEVYLGARVCSPCALPHTPGASVWPLQNHDERCAKSGSMIRQLARVCIVRFWVWRLPESNVRFGTQSIKSLEPPNFGLSWVRLLRGIVGLGVWC